MRFPIRGRLWWVLAAAVFLAGPLYVIGFPGDATTAEKAMVILASMLCVGLIFGKYAMVSAIRLDETGIVVERRLLPNVAFAWRGTVISYHRGQRRVAEGLMIESTRTDGEDREPYFFPLRDVENSDQLLTELRERLAMRFREEEGR